MTTLILADKDSEASGLLASNLALQKTDWRIVELSSGAQILDFVTGNPVDGIISKDDLQDMGGLDLLGNLQSLSAEPVRILLVSEDADATTYDTAQAEHQVVFQSATPDTLLAVIDTALQLRQALNSDELKHQIEQIHSLPSLPEVYKEMVRELASPQSSLMQVSSLIESDLGLTGTVLKIVNSAFYGLNQKVESVSQGVALLGVHTIKNITLTAKVFSQFKGGEQGLQLLKQLNDQANIRGALANQFARLAHFPKAVTDQTQVAGMLANIGLLLQLDNPELNSAPETAIEQEMLGAYLLKTWLLPEPVTNAVAHQHKAPPCNAGPITPAMVLHAIRYLEAHMQDVDNAAQSRKCTEYIQQFVETELASQWVDAFRDLRMLTGHIDVRKPRAA